MKQHGLTCTGDECWEAWSQHQRSDYEPVGRVVEGFVEILQCVSTGVSFLLCEMEHPSCRMHSQAAISDSQHTMNMNLLRVCCELWKGNETSDVSIFRGLIKSQLSSDFNKRLERLGKYQYHCLCHYFQV